MDELALGRLSERDSEVWEEHLLVCAACQDRLAEADDYIRVMQSAATSLKDDSAPAPSGLPAKKPMMAALTLAMALALV